MREEKTPTVINGKCERIYLASKKRCCIAEYGTTSQKYKIISRP